MPCYRHVRRAVEQVPEGAVAKTKRSFLIETIGMPIEHMHADDRLPPDAVHVIVQTARRGPYAMV